MEVKWNGGLGAIIALLVLVIVIVFWATGKMPPMYAMPLAGLAIARLC